jgi:tight adherence protein C
MELWLIAGFFAFMMAAVSVIGYFVFLRPRAIENTEIPLALQSPSVEGPQALLMRIFYSLGEAVPIREQDRRLTQARLNRAGYRWPTALAVFYGSKCAGALVIALIFTVIALNTRDDWSLALLAAVCGIGLGYLLPERFLDSQIRRRNDRLRRALAPALDLLVMSIEAGQSLDLAMLSASRALKALFPDLSAEFAQVHLETRASKSRAEAIRHMVERNTEPDLRKFCQLLLDSDRFGTSVGPTLRNHAKYLRIRFRQKAQETARKLSVKMVFPVFFLIFPSVLVVTLGPAVLLMYRSFKSMM